VTRQLISSGSTFEHRNRSDGAPEANMTMANRREGSAGRSTGGDVWVFEQRGADWIAVWRTMQALEETPASPGPPAG
jgi:hypothetical protein